MVIVGRTLSFIPGLPTPFHYHPANDAILAKMGSHRMISSSWIGWNRHDQPGFLLYCTQSVMQKIFVTYPSWSFSITVRCIINAALWYTFWSLQAFAKACLRQQIFNFTPNNKCIKNSFVSGRLMIHDELPSVLLHGDIYQWLLN